MKIFNIKRFDIITILAAFSLSMLMYPRPILYLSQLIEDIRVAIELSNYTSNMETAELPDENRIQVVFMFDGGWQSIYTSAYPIFKKYGYKGSIAIIPSLVNEEGRMSYSQIGELYMDGWSVLNHSYSYRTSADCYKLFEEFQRTKDWMDKRFLTKGKKMAIIPYDCNNPYLIKLLIDSGYDNVRTQDNVIVLDVKNAKNTVYYPITIIGLLQDSEVSEVKSHLLEAWNEKRSIAFVLNKIGQTADRYKMTYAPERLEEILQFIHENEDRFQLLAYSDLFSSH